MGEDAKVTPVLVSPAINSWESLSLEPQNHFGNHDLGTWNCAERMCVYTYI